MHAQYICQDTIMLVSFNSVNTEPATWEVLVARNTMQATPLTGNLSNENLLEWYVHLHNIG